MVANVSKGPVESGGTADYEQHLNIPSSPPSNLVNCGIIDLEYKLNVKVCVEGWLVLSLSALRIFPHLRFDRFEIDLPFILFFFSLYVDINSRRLSID